MNDIAKVHSLEIILETHMNKYSVRWKYRLWCSISEWCACLRYTEFKLFLLQLTAVCLIGIYEH